MVIAQSSVSGGFGSNLPDSNSVAYSLRNNTSIWNFGINQKHEFSSGSVYFREYFETTRLEFSSGKPRWKDDQKLDIIMEIPFTKYSKISGEAFSNVFKDRHTGLFNDTRTSFVNIGIRDETISRTNILVMGGPVWDARRQQNDSGYRFASSVSSRGLNISDWKGDIAASINGSRFQARENQSQRARLKISKKFYEETSDSFFVDIRKKRQDYFISESGDIERRTESSDRFSNNLKYKLSKNLKLRWSAKLGFRETDIESPQKNAGEVKRIRKDELSDNLLTFSYFRKTWNGRFSTGYRNSSQKYSVSTSESELDLPLLSPNNDAASVILSSIINFNPTKKDSIALRVLSHRLRYDTPDTNNFDDRDEIRLAIESGYTHRFAQDFNLGLRVAMNFDHIVYLFGERSIDNHWNRVFSISTKLGAKLTQRIYTNQTFGVLANYFDFDFEDGSQPIRSLVLRNFIHRQTTRIELNNKVGIRINSRFELEEDGKLDWDNFLEQRVAGRTITSLEAEISYNPFRRTYISGGLSRSSRTETRFRGFNDGGIKAVELIGFGPVFHAYYRAGNNKIFSVKGKIQRVENISGGIYYTKFIRIVGSLLI